MKNPPPETLALINLATNTPIFRESVMINALNAAAGLLGIPQENHEQLVAALCASGKLYDKKTTEAMRKEGITIYRAVVEALPEFRAAILKALKRNRSKLPDWV